MEAQGQLKDKKINDLEQVTLPNEKPECWMLLWRDMKYVIKDNYKLENQNQLRCQVHTDFKNCEILSLQRKFETFDSRLAAEHSKSNYQVCRELFITTKISNSRTSVKNLSVQVRERDQMIAELNEKLRVANEELQNPIVKTKEGATYTQEMCDSVFSCAMNNVPVLEIASVIKDLGDNLFHKKS